MTYTVEFTEEEHRYIEKVLDQQAALLNSHISKLICDGQFLIPREDVLCVRAKFNDMINELFRGEDILRQIRTKLENGYRSANKEEQ